MGDGAIEKADESNKVVALATYRKDEISLAERHDILEMRCEELEIEKLELENKIIELEQQLKEKDKKKKKKKISFANKFLSYWLRIKACFYRKTVLEMELNREIKKIERHKKINQEQRKKLTDFLVELGKNLKEITSGDEKVSLYKPTLNFKYVREINCFYATIGKEGWNDDDLIDKIFKKGIDPDEFKTTVEKNFLEYLKNREKDNT